MPTNQPITSLELRNYILQPGARSAFHQYFNEHFVEAMAELGGHTLGQYAVAGQPDNFCWLRGFANWEVRSAFLPAFYTQGACWKTFGPAANALIQDSDNVHLLQPVQPVGEEDFRSLTGTVMVDFYLAQPGRLHPLLEAALATSAWPTPATGRRQTLWVSESRPNNFPRLPAFQDPDLLVALTPVEQEASDVVSPLGNPALRTLPQLLREHRRWTLHSL